MKKTRFLIPILTLLLTACSPSSTSYFSAFTAEGFEAQYKESGTVCLKGDQNAVSLYVSASAPASITLTGTMSTRSGSPSLICQYPDGSTYTVAGSQDSVLDTEIPLKDGINCIRFDGADSTLDFDLVYGNLDAPEIISYSQSQPQGDGALAASSPELHSLAGSTPSDTFPSRTVSSQFTQVSEPAEILEFQLEKETDITVFVAIDLHNNSTGRFKAGAFDVTLKGDGYPSAEIIHHATTDSSWGDFRWTDHNLVKLTLPKGSYQLVLSDISGKNYALRLDAAVYPTNGAQ